MNIYDNIEGWQVIEQENTANLLLYYFRMHSTQLAKETTFFGIAFFMSNYNLHSIQKGYKHMIIITYANARRNYR